MYIYDYAISMYQEYKYITKRKIYKKKKFD